MTAIVLDGLWAARAGAGGGRPVARRLHRRSSPCSAQRCREDTTLLTIAGALPSLCGSIEVLALESRTARPPDRPPRPRPRARRSRGSSPTSPSLRTCACAHAAHPHTTPSGSPARRDSSRAVLPGQQRCAPATALARHPAGAHDRRAEPRARAHHRGAAAPDRARAAPTLGMGVLSSSSTSTPRSRSPPGTCSIVGCSCSRAPPHVRRRPMCSRSATSRPLRPTGFLMTPWNSLTKTDHRADPRSRTSCSSPFDPRPRA